MSNLKQHRVLEYILIVSAVILIVLLVFFVIQYRNLRHQQILTTHQLRLSELLHHRQPLTAADADIIRSWMTFDYINKLFAVPPTYLQSALHITDTHYPKMTLSQYASRNHLVVATVVQEVQSALQNKPATTASSTSSQ